MPDMTQELKDQRRRDFDHTLRDMAPKLDSAKGEMQQVIDSLAHLATVLPGKEPMAVELRLASTLLKKLSAVSQDVATVKALRHELLNK